MLCIFNNFKLSKLILCKNSSYSNLVFCSSTTLRKVDWFLEFFTFYQFFSGGRFHLQSTNYIQISIRNIIEVENCNFFVYLL